MPEGRSEHGSLAEEVSALVAVLGRREDLVAGVRAEWSDPLPEDGPRRDPAAGPLGGFFSAQTLDSLADLADAAAAGLRRVAGAAREAGSEPTPPTTATADRTDDEEAGPA